MRARPAWMILALLLLVASLRAQAPSAVEEIRALLAGRSGAAAGTYGVHVSEAATGETLFAADAAQARMPASAMKLVTTGAALLTLEEDYRFRTLAVAGGAPRSDGMLLGDLVIVGGGDPSITTAGLESLARALKGRGLSRIGGDLVLDTGRFRGPLRHASWPRDQLSRSYCAPASSLVLERNCVTVRVRPGATVGQRARVTLSPPTRVIAIRNEIVTSPGKGDPKVSLELPPGGDTIRCRGTIPLKSVPYEHPVAVNDPAAYFGDVLHRSLVRFGIALGGKVVRRPGAASQLETKEILASLETGLLEVMTVANRESENLYADCILKILGHEGGKEGSFQGGAAVTRDLAKRLGSPESELDQADGSGLSRENRVSPRSLTLLLSHLYRQGKPVAVRFMETLAIGGGAEGTLSKRLGDLSRNVRAKTGTIRGVSALAGYLRAKSGKVLCFAFLLNDTKAARTPLARARRLQDELCRILYRRF